MLFFGDLVVLSIAGELLYFLLEGLVAGVEVLFLLLQVFYVLLAVLLEQLPLLLFLLGFAGFPLQLLHCLLQPQLLACVFPSEELQLFLAHHNHFLAGVRWHYLPMLEMGFLVGEAIQLLQVLLILQFCEMLPVDIDADVYLLLLLRIGLVRLPTFAEDGGVELGGVELRGVLSRLRLGDHCLTAVLPLRSGEGIEGVGLRIIEAGFPVPRDVVLLFGLEQVLLLLARAEGI